MSTEDQNRAIITFKKGVDTDQAVNELIDQGYELHNSKPDSVSNFDFVMTLDQAEALKSDERVRDVRYGSKEENGFVPMHNIIEPSRNHQRDNTANNTHYPWAFAECTSTTTKYSSGSTAYTYSHAYSLDGEGVDSVVQDSGIEVGHPEWLARDGVTNRLKQIDWPTASGFGSTYTQGANHYTDQYGHGTHCASTMAGRLYGWANGSDIYAIKIFDTDAFGVSASFNMIRGWHNNKGNNRPTVVNMSWGYFGTYTNITGGNYRGTPWTGATQQTAYGMVFGNTNNNGDWTHPVRITSVESDMEDCITDGVILVGAAGNSQHKMDLTTGLDYNNYFTNNFGNRYYHRGGTPQAATDTICVGAIDYTYQTGTQERCATFTEKGPRVDIFAPGYAIQAAIPQSATLSTNTATYPTNSSYKIRKLQGTSMACPQVAGIVATLLQARPDYTPQQCMAWIQDQAVNNRLYDPTVGTSADYTNNRALQTANNKYLQTPFVSGEPKKFSGGIQFSTS